MSDTPLSIEECAAAMVELYTTLLSGAPSVAKSFALPVGTVNRWDVTVGSKKDPTYYMKYGKDDWREVKSDGHKWVLSDGGKKATDSTSGEEHEPRDPKGMLEHRINHVDRILNVASDRFASAGGSGSGRVAHDVGYALSMAKNRLMAMGEEGKKAWEAEVEKSWHRINKILETNDLMKAGKADSIDPAVKAMYKRIVGLLGESFIREAKGEETVPPAPVAEKPKEPEAAKPVAEKPAEPKVETAPPKKKKAAGKKEPKTAPAEAPAVSTSFPEGALGSDELDEKIIADYFATKDTANIDEYLRRMYAMVGDLDYAPSQEEQAKHLGMISYAAMLAPKTEGKESKETSKKQQAVNEKRLLQQAEAAFRESGTIENLAINARLKFNQIPIPPNCKQDKKRELSQINLNNMRQAAHLAIGDADLLDTMTDKDVEIANYMEENIQSKAKAKRMRKEAIEDYRVKLLAAIHGYMHDDEDVPKPETSPRGEEPEGVDADTESVDTRDLFIDGDLLDDPEEKPKPSVFEPASGEEKKPEVSAPAEAESEEVADGGEEKKPTESKVSKKEAQLAKQLKAAQAQIDGLMKKLKEASTTKDKEVVQQALGDSLGSLSGGLIMALGLPFAAAMLVLALPLLLLLAVNKIV